MELMTSAVGMLLRQYGLVSSESVRQKLNRFKGKLVAFFSWSLSPQIHSIEAADSAKACHGCQLLCLSPALILTAWMP